MFGSRVKAEVESSLCLTKYHAVKTYWGVEVYRHSFLTLSLDGGERLSSGPLDVRLPRGIWTQERIRRKLRKIA